MREVDLQRLFDRDPRPLLRLHLTGGMAFDIRETDVVVLTRSVLELLLPADHSQQREAVINLLHIVWIEVESPAD